MKYLLIFLILLLKCVFIHGVVDIVSIHTIGLQQNKYCNIANITNTATGTWNIRPQMEAYIQFNNNSRLALGSQNDILSFSFNYNNIPNQLLYINAYVPLDQSATFNLSLNVNGSITTVPLTGFNCTRFINRTIKLKNNLLNYTSIFNPKSTRSLFGIEFDDTPISSLACRLTNSQSFSSCTIAPYDPEVSSNPNARLLTRVTLSPQPSTFVSWDPVVVEIYDPLWNATSAFVTVSFPGMTSTTTTTTLVTSILPLVPNNSTIDYTYPSNFFDVFVNVAAKNSELIFYRANVLGDAGTASPYATYRPIRGSDDNALLHFPIPYDSTSSNTSTVMYTLESHSFTRKFNSFYSFNKSQPQGLIGLINLNNDYSLCNSTFTTLQPTTISWRTDTNAGTPIIYPTWPFGVVNRTASQSLINYKFELAYNSTTNTTFTSWLPHKIIATSRKVEFPSPPTLYAPLSNVSIQRISSYQFILQLTVVDPTRFNGAFLQNSDSTGLNLAASNFVQPGVYEYEVNLTRNSLANYWRMYLNTLSNDQQIIYRQNDFYSVGKQVPPLPTFNIKSTDITQLYWSPSTVDVSNGPATSTLYFNLTYNSNNTNFYNETPGLMVYQLQRSNVDDYSQYVFGSWNSTLRLFQIQVTIKEKIYGGNLFYYLASGDFGLFGELIATNPLIGQSAFLKVQCSSADEIGPLVNQLTTNVVQNQIVWVMEIQDSNGLYLNNDYSYGLVSSNLDPYPHKVSINRVNGTAFDGFYNCLWNLTGARPTIEEWRLDLVLQDYLGNVAQSIPKNGPIIQSNLNPFMTLNSQRFINVSNTKNNTDYTPPTFNPESFNVSTSIIDVGSVDSINRTFTVKFNCSDSGSGIYLGTPPTLFIVSYEATIQQPFTIEYQVSGQYDGDTVYVEVGYTATIELPFGFGYNQLPTISIYGLMDNNKNMIGFSSLDLKNLYLQFSIQTKMESLLPFIQSISPINLNVGGFITIRGNRFGQLGSSGTVVLVNGNVVSSGAIVFLSGPLLVFNISSQTTNSVTIQVNVRGKYSNVVTISNPVEPTFNPPRPQVVVPTNPPKQCPKGNLNTSMPALDCFGNGNCLVDGSCQCFSTPTIQWSGPACDSKSTPTNTTVDPNHPSTITNGTDIVAGISIIAVQEFDIQGQLVANYSLDGLWRFTNSTDDSINSFIYSATYESTLNSSIVVKVQTFEENTNVSFAGQTSLMNKGSVKFSMSLTSYPFQSPLNQLAVLMTIDVAGSNSSDDCSGIESQLSSGESIEWLKLKVNDKSLYGRFMNTGYVDGRITTITNIIVKQQQTTSTAKTTVAMKIPNYRYSTLIDPNFGLLLEPKKTNDYCNPDNKWSAGMLAGVILGSAGAAGVLGFIGFMLVKKKFKYTYKIMMESRKHKQMEAKLSNLNDPLQKI